MPTRRQVLRYGLVGLAAGVWPGLPAGTPTSPGWRGELGCRLPTFRAAAAAVRPEPFTATLRLPVVAEPVRRDATTDHYEVEMRLGEVEVAPGLRTQVWGYDGAWPGPTIRARVGRRVVVTYRNRLEVPTAIHLHGANAGADSDGHPLDLIPPGAAKPYRYPNRQQGATLWYHDHAMHVTAEQIYRGLAGLYLLDDPAEDGLGLPSGDRELPLLVQDRTFDEQGRLLYDPGDHSGFLGEVVCVNGVAHPVAAVSATTYRLRLVNGANARTYQFALSDASPMDVVATDGGLLARPVRATAVTLGPAERADVVVDLRAAAGGSVDLVDRFASADEPAVLRFEVAGTGPAPAGLPATLRPLPTPPAATRTREVELGFDTDRNLWVLNGLGFDADRLDARIRLGETEVWRLRNTSHMPHPLHLHLVQFRVLARDGALPPSVERGWKDTVRVAPGETVDVLATFSGHTGTFIYHCHNLEHEDHDMMAQFRVTDRSRVAGAGRLETAAAVSATTFAAGVSAALIATAGDFADALCGGPAAAVVGGPVLLTAGQRLPVVTADELRRLQPAEIVILGGTRAVPVTVEDDLRALDLGPVRRIAGTSRFATAAGIADAFFATGVPVVYLATGSAFPDALAGGAAAAALGGPMLLVTRDAVPPETAEALRGLQPAGVVVLGGERAVSEQVRAELSRIAGVDATRVAGADRFGTAAAVSAAVFAPSTEVALIATGADYPDALAGVPAAAVHEAPLLLTTRDALPEVTAAELRRLAPSRIIVLGGPGAVSDAVATALDVFVDG